VVIALSAVVLAANLQSARANSATWDEPLYMFLGRQAALGDAHHEFAALGVAPLPVRLAWTSGALDPLAVEHGDVGAFEQRVQRARRNAIGWFAVPLVLAIFAVIAMRRGIMTGAVAASLVALSPNVIAHASLATTDVAFALAFVLTTAALIAYFERRSMSLAIALAAALGTALATKYSAVLFMPVVAILLGLRWRDRRWATDFAFIGGSIVVAWAWHGWATAPLFAAGGTGASMIREALAWTGQGPAIAERMTGLPVPIMWRGIAAQAFLERAGQESFLLGHVSQHGWWYFFPVALAMKSTPVELGALAVFTALAMRRFLDVERQVVLTVVAVFGGAALTGNRDLGVRYVLPLVILAIVAAVAWTADWLRARRLRFAIGISAVAIQAVTCLTIAPHHLAYFNGLAGGPALGYTRLVDSNLDWGQDLWRLKAWVDATPETEIGIAYFGSAPLASYGITPVDWRSLLHDGSHGPAASFVLSATYLQGVFLCGDPFAPFRALEPSARIGYTLLAYATDRDEVRRALATAVSDPCAPHSH
jgi:hypothetical protein